MRTFLGALAVAASLAAVAGCGSSGGDSSGTESAGGWAGLSQRAARTEAAKLIRDKYPLTDAKIAYVSQGFDPISRREAWDITFYNHPGSEFTGCRVYVWDGGGRVDNCDKAARPESGA